MIIVDSREKQSNIPKLLSELEVQYSIATLDVGDYIIGEEICVERKTISDYISSLISGRLHNELYKMSYTYNLSFLAIIGFPTIELQQRSMGRPMFISSIVGSTYKTAIEGKQGRICILAPLETDFDFALALKYLHQKYIEQKPRLPTIPKDVVSDKDRMVFVLSAFPNVGEVKSKQLLEKFTTLNNIFNATSKELSETIGEKRGLELFLWLHKIYQK